MTVNSKTRAILGPTNTGKTHTAIERLLAYSSGIIGFPLRLLAKENYDRMVAIKGNQHVGLITGEEKIIPPQARWFSCTVETMPTHLITDIVIIDEIQLCADPERGHIFTDRLLHCHGKYETIFLGSDTIAPVLKKLLPGIEIETRPRLSSLLYNGFTKLTRLPPRCAIVAFSIHEVYAIAELIKRQKGGCAIIMGRLSPRTRNAQMELYQNKEVDYLIATDAIGMGLNMNVNHIAFASLSKYDGRQMRNLYATEIAQIAGRAGRGLQDGTFGTTANCNGISDKNVQSVENHLFDPLKQIYWRNHHLDFNDPITLFNSMTRSSAAAYLITSRHASDLQTLSFLIQDRNILKLCTNQDRTKLLWECCQIPDFKKLGNEYHARICQQIFLFLIKQNYIPESWINQQIQQVNHMQGDIDTLMQRLASIRICAYITTKNNWLYSAPYWQAQTRQVEEQLSDVLHDSLMKKFVNQRITHIIRNLSHQKQLNQLISVTQDGKIIIEGQEIGTIQGFTLQLNDTFPKHEHALLLKNIRKALTYFIPQQVRNITQAKDNEFQLDYEKKLILWNRVPLAKMQKGQHFFQPIPIILKQDLLDSTLQSFVLNRLKAYIHTLIHDCFPQFFQSLNQKHNAPIIQGILYQLYENGGIIKRENLPPLSRETRNLLNRHQIHCGNHAIYIQNIFKAKLYSLHRLLCMIYEQTPDLPLLPLHKISGKTPVNIKPDVLQRSGWIIAGKQVIRMDFAERLTHVLQKKTRSFPVVFKKKHISPIPYHKDNILELLKTLKLYTQPPQKPSHQFIGPPAPLLFSRFPFRKRKKERQRQQTPHQTENSHFSLLKTLYPSQ